MNAMSKELVPTTYDRNAYNTIRGVETRHHDGLLTGEQAKEINENFDVLIVPVRHGIGLDRDPQALEKDFAPGDDDYEHVKKIINSLDHGDVLFVEGVGFESENDATMYMPEENMKETRRRAYESNDPNDPDIIKFLNAHLRLVSDRENYTIDALDYAHQHAFFHGIEVVFADMDAYDNDRLEKVVEQEGRHPWGEPLNPNHAAAAHALREKKAINTIKDFALEKLEHQPEQEGANNRKPKLVLLYGSKHADAFREGFSNVGIESHILPPVEDDPVKRRHEFMTHIATKHAA
jgi:hypothetical protein